MEKNMDRNSTLSWSAYIGCMFVGMGVGAIFNEAGIGTLIGLGVGFIASAIIERKEKTISKEQ